VYDEAKQPQKAEKFRAELLTASSK
jgi:hypothetical protein